MDNLNPLEQDSRTSNNTEFNMSGTSELDQESQSVDQGQITTKPMEEGDIITPHYVIVEDPITIHSYADLSGYSLASDFNMAVDKQDSSSSTTENKDRSNNYDLFGIDDNVESSPDIVKHIDDKSMKKDTILTVPILSIPKHSANESKTNEDDIDLDIPFSICNELNSPNPIITSKMNQIKAEDKKLQVDLVSGTEPSYPLNDSAKDEEDHLEKVLDECQMEVEKKSKEKLKDYVQNSNEESLPDQPHVDSVNVDKDKTMFSENLGLIPADAEPKLIAQRAKKGNIGVRTRKSLVSKAEKTDGKTGSQTSVADALRSAYLHTNMMDTIESPPTPGHTHKTGSYRCGSCSRSFTVICKLHDHLQEHCASGSYHYDHMLRTAFPKYDTTCSYAQTNFDFSDEESLSRPKKINLREETIKTRLKIRAPTGRAKTSTVKRLSNMLEKRKRGRPPKKQKATVVKIENKSVIELVNDTSNEDMCVDIMGFDDTHDYESETDKKQHFLNESLELMSKDELKMGRSDHLLKKGIDKLSKITEDEKSDSIQSPQTQSRDQMRSHKRKMSIPRKIMKMSSEDKEKVINSRTKPENKIKCEYCPSMFQYTRGLIRHEQEKHADKMEFECDQCNLRFMRQYNLERHKLCTHRPSKTDFAQHRKGIYRDKKEKKQVKQKSEKSAEKTQTKETSTACEICGNNVPDSKMDVHVRLHTGERPYICHVCGKGLISDKKLKRHLLIHSEVQKHTCDVCGEGFAMKYKLRTHMFIHTGHKPYLCSVCGAEFNNSTSLLHHNRTVHLGDKRFECTICGGRYGKKSQLEEHMFSHSDERTQTCRYCGKTFKHAKSLRRHEASHVNDAKFQCDQCDSKFSRKDNLERHKMCHFESTLQCSFCKKKFRERQPLLDHEKFHINQRKFQCQLCKDKFQEESYFYNHMEKSHGVTRDMVQVVNQLASSPVKETKSRKVTKNNNVQNVIIDRLKLNPDSDHLGISETRAIDTLNRCMSVAGILPTSSTNQELAVRPVDQSTLHVGSQTQTSLLNPMFNVGMNIGIPNAILNPNINDNFTTVVSVGTGINTPQRITLSSINVGENGTIRLSLDQPESTITLGSESTILSDQQRLMQDVNAIHSLQDQGYRLPNMY